MVQHARADDPARARAALAELCRSYWPPLYAFVRRGGASTDDAAELVQDFFAALLDGDPIAGFDPQRGRFRSWLLGALRHHELKRLDRARAGKRGAGILVVDFDARVAEHAVASLGETDLSPEQAYERAWAIGLLQRTQTRLRQEYEARGAAAEFDALAPVLSRDDALPYARIAEQLGKKAGAVKVAAHRLRKRYGDLLRAEVAETVADPSEVDAELRTLIEAVRRR